MSSTNNPFEDEEQNELDMEDPPADTAMAAADLEASSHKGLKILFFKRSATAVGIYFS